LLCPPVSISVFTFQGAEYDDFDIYAISDPPFICEYCFTLKMTYWSELLSQAVSGDCISKEMLVSGRLVGGCTAPKPLFGNSAFRSVSAKPLRVCCDCLSAVYNA
jgi:hypothetical protein